MFEKVIHLFQSSSLLINTFFIIILPFFVFFVFFFSSVLLLFFFVFFFISMSQKNSMKRFSRHIKKDLIPTVASVTNIVIPKRYHEWKQLFELVFDLETLGVSFFGSIVRDHLVPLNHDGLWPKKTFNEFLNQQLNPRQEIFFQRLLRRPFPNNLNVMNVNESVKSLIKNLENKDSTTLSTTYYQKWEIRGLEKSPVFSSSDKKTFNQYQFVVFQRNEKETSILVKVMLTSITSKHTSDMNVSGLFYSSKQGIHTKGIPSSPELIKELIDQCLARQCRIGSGVLLDRIIKMLKDGWRITNLICNFMVHQYSCNCCKKTHLQQSKVVYFYCCGLICCEKSVYDIGESNGCLRCSKSCFEITVNRCKRL